MTDTNNTTPIEDAEPEPTFHCENCLEGFDNPNSLHPIIVGRRSGYPMRYTTEDWCDLCRDEHSVYVEDLDEIVSYEFAANEYYCWDDGTWHTECEESECDDDETEGLLYSYGTDILDVYSWPSATRRDSLCMGVELEMEAKTRRDFQPMLDILHNRDGNGNYILKADGSLEDGQGAELVTLPFTLEGHRTLFDWPRVLNDKLRTVAMSGRGTTSCGIHIHVNRRALSALTIGKLLVFLNSPSNDSLVTCIAQRQSGTFCERDERKAKVTAVRADDGCRYDILNISGHRTIEFRMFRGNLRPERVLKNLEFCHSLIRYCEQSGIKEAEDKGLYLAWLERNAKSYPHLVSFLIEKGRITRPNPRSTANYATMAMSQAVEA